MLYEIFKTGLAQTVDLNQKLLAQPEDFRRFEALVHLLVATLKADKNIFIAGNGGSHCDALHFAEELTGKYREPRRPLGALALGEASHLTCVGNDYGFEYALLRQFQALAKPGDCLIGLSTSGNSANLVQLFEWANTAGFANFALLGRDGGRMKSIARNCLIIPGNTSDRIQELHMQLLHLSIEGIEAALNL